MCRLLRACGFVALAAACPPSFAAEPIVIGETLRISSKVMGEERTLLVSTPPGYQHGNGRFPLLVLLDGPAHLVHTRGTIDFLAGNGLMPQMIVVGIANTDRTRDLTPTKGTVLREDGTPYNLPTAGGGDRFLEFIGSEVLPLVERSYRTEPFRVLAGHSFGALFAVNTLLTRPELFDATIAASPTAGWDEELLRRRAASFLAERKELKKVLFMSLASEGAAADTTFDALTRAFKKARLKDFRFDTARFLDEDHGSVVLRTHYHAFRMIFDGWRLPVKEGTRRFEGDLDDVTAHYRELSTRLGFSVKPPELVVNQLGYRYLQAGDVKRAVEAFRYNATTWPDSPNVYDSLGEALERAGELNEALASYEKAVSLGERQSDGNLGAFKANRDRLWTLVSSK